MKNKRQWQVIQTSWNGFNILVKKYRQFNSFIMFDKNMSDKRIKYFLESEAFKATKRLLNLA